MFIRACANQLKRAEASGQQFCGNSDHISYSIPFHPYTLHNNNNNNNNSSSSECDSMQITNAKREHRLDVQHDKRARERESMIEIKLKSNHLANNCGIVSKIVCSFYRVKRGLFICSFFFFSAALLCSLARLCRILLTNTHNLRCVVVHNTHIYSINKCILILYDLLLRSKKNGNLC